MPRFVCSVQGCSYHKPRGWITAPNGSMLCPEHAALAAGFYLQSPASEVNNYEALVAENSQEPE